MKLDPDCIRDVLLSIESLPYTGYRTIDELAAEYPHYEQISLDYTCLKLHEAGLIEALLVSSMGQWHQRVLKIYDLTFRGHEFLNSIRGEKVWSKTMSVVKNIGSSSLEILKDVAVKVAASLITQSI